MRCRVREFPINSTEFREMRDTLYRLGKFSKDLKEKYPEGSMEMSEEERQELSRQYEKLKEVSEAYIEAKKLSPKTEHGKLRLYLANEIRDLAADNGDFLEEMKTSETKALDVEENEMVEPEIQEPEFETPALQEPLL